MNKISRRDFLKLGNYMLLSISGMLGLGGLFRFFGYETEPPAKTEFEVGKANEYAIGSRTFLADIPAILTRTEDGFSALSLVCSHLGCTVDQDGGGFSCPCHGSRYGLDGQLVNGPATQALPSLDVHTREDGLLIVSLN